jgi:hypothetical protein
MSPNTLSLEAIASITFGILHLAVGLAALWQQRQARLLHRMCFWSLSDDTAFTIILEVEVRFEGRRYTI